MGGSFATADQPESEYQMSIESLATWTALPELSCPVVADGEEGFICMVRKVGFLALTPKDCKTRGLLRVPFEGGKFFFPTIDIEEAGSGRLYRLPGELGNWVIDMVALTRQRGESPFPTRIEFGILHDRHYAEIL